MKKIKNVLTSETAYLIYMTVASIILAIIIIWQLFSGAFPSDPEKDAQYDENKRAAEITAAYYSCFAPE